MANLRPHEGLKLNVYLAFLLVFVVYGAFFVPALMRAIGSGASFNLSRHIVSPQNGLIRASAGKCE